MLFCFPEIWIPRRFAQHSQLVSTVPLAVIVKRRVPDFVTVFMSLGVGEDLLIMCGEAPLSMLCAWSPADVEGGDGCRRGFF